MEHAPGGRWGQVLALAGFLLFAPPMFLFGPLAALLLVSRPATLREWVWLLGAVGWSALWLQQAGGLGAQFARSAAVLVSGSFLALTLWRPSNGVCRALTATAGAAAALGVWMVGLGLRWATLQAAVEDALAVGDRPLALTQAVERAEHDAARVVDGIPAGLGDVVVADIVGMDVDGAEVA